MGSEARNEDDSFLCPICKRSFKTKKGRKSHLKDKHNKKMSEMKEEYTIPVSIEGWEIYPHEDLEENYYIQTPLNTEIIFSNVSFFDNFIHLKEGNTLIATLDGLIIPDELFKTLILRMDDIRGGQDS